MVTTTLLRKFSLVNLFKTFDNNPQIFKTMVSLYPPFLCAGIKVTEVTEDFKYIRVEMGLKWFNKNYVGTQFGGSLYAMTDPFLMIMLMKNLGRDYIVWDKSATINFIRPGTGKVVAEFRLEEDVIRQIREEVEKKTRYIPEFSVEVKDQDGETVATVQKKIYIRKKKK